jgi:hypothetical protein
MIFRQVDKIWKLTNVERVRLVPRSEFKSFYIEHTEGPEK